MTPMDPYFVEAEPTLFEAASTAVTISGGSKISWTDYTFNPWWGCKRVSPGCTNCYAETFSHRLGFNAWGERGDRRFFGDKHWADPLRWDKRARREGVRRRVFCASMADVFEDRASLPEYRERLWSLIESTTNLDWMLLTKRPENIRSMVPPSWLENWPAQAWAGTTTEDQQRADERLPHLLDVPAAIRFLSAEPLLGPVDVDLAGISLVIAGGESGHGARPMHIGWVRHLRDRCVATGTPFHFKQWGEWGPAGAWRGPDHHLTIYGELFAPNERLHLGHLGEPSAIHRWGAKAAGRELDGRTWDEMPACTAWEAEPA